MYFFKKYHLEYVTNLCLRMHMEIAFLLAGNVMRVLVTANPNARIGFHGNYVTQVGSKGNNEDTVISFLDFICFSYHLNIRKRLILSTKTMLQSQE